MDRKWKYAHVDQAVICYVYSSIFLGGVEFLPIIQLFLSFFFFPNLYIWLPECFNIQILCNVWCMLISTHSHSCAPRCIMCSKAKRSGDNLLSSFPTHSSILLTEAAQWATLQLVGTQEKKSLSQQESSYTYANTLPVSRITRKIQ